MSAIFRPSVLASAIDGFIADPGVPLFDGAFQPFRFQLAGSHISPSGVLFLAYASGGS